MVTDNEFVLYRYDLLTGDGGIIRPADPSICPHAPFDTMDYPYANRLGSLESTEWRTLLGLKPADIIAGNPYALSKYRRGYACWDTAVAVPACSIRTDKITSIKQLGPSRNSNTFWTSVVSPALRMVGPIGKDGKIVRPKIPGYSVDYKAIDYLEVIEAAHVLAHIRGDEAKVGKKAHYAQSFTDKHFVQAMSEITISLLFDIPINISRRYASGGVPNLPYGIKVTSTTNYQEPMLIVPWKGAGALAFDETNVIIHTAVHIEPYPYGYLTGSGKYTEDDRWCCMPAMVTIVGIECVDYLTHQNVVMVGGEPCYIMHYLDLMPPDYISNVFSLGELAYGKQQPDAEWMTAADWINSTHFYNSFMETPALPCRECMLHNRASEGKPMRPDTRPPKTLKKSDPWYRYELELKRIMRLIRFAVNMHLLRFFTGKYLRETLRQRVSGYKRKLRRIKDSIRLLKIHERVQQGKPLTERDQKLYWSTKK